MPRRSRRPVKRRSNTSTYVVMLVLAGGLAALIFIARRTGIGQDQAEAEAARSKSARDPFADLPTEKPPPRAGQKVDAEGNIDPFADAPENLLAETRWQTSQVLIEEARDLREQALAFLDQGDRKQAQEVGLKSKHRFEQALEWCRDWAVAAEQRYGEDEPQVKKIMNMRRRWNIELQALRKNANV